MKACGVEYEFNAIIHQVGKSNLEMVFCEPLGSKPTIHLSYHMGRHYNSVRREDDPMHLKKAPIKVYPISHDMKENVALIESKGTSCEQNIRFKKQTKETYNQVLYDDLTESIYPIFGWMFSGPSENDKKAKLRIATETAHQNLKDCDPGSIIQMSLNIMNKEEEDTSDKIELSIDPIKLRQQLSELKQNSNIIVDIMKGGELHNLVLIKR